MSRRKWMTLMTIVGSVFGLGAVKVLQIQAAIAQASSFQPPPEAVTTVVARAERWPTTLSAIGTVRAVRGVTLSADLPGVVEELAFESGRPVRQGEVLVRLDTRQERAQLAAAEAQSELARVNLERVQGLVRQGIVAQAELDRASAEHKQAEARVGEIRATIERKQIRAPFAGVLGIRQVDLGQYLNAGDPIVPLQATDPVYVNFSVPQQQVGALLVGREVRATASGLERELKGRISAVDAVVDAGTRNVQAQATFANPDGALRPGMFVETHVVTGEETQVLVLPASAISYAPYGDSVFVVSDAEAKQGPPAGKTVSQQFVKLGTTRGDQVAVLSGIQPGSEVVSSGAFKLRSGAAVRVNNEVQPTNDPNPRPADN